MKIPVNEIRGIEPGKNRAEAMLIDIHMSEWMLRDVMAMICEELGDEEFMAEVRRLIDA